MRVALWQASGFPADVAANLAALEPVARAAAAAGASLLLTPECWLCGYNIGAEAAVLAQARDGDAAVRIARIAAANGIGIAYGYAERDAAAIYNAVQLIGPAGAPLANYRKTHLFGPAERAVFRPGAGFEAPVGIGGFKTGLLICYDIEYPECVRALALMGTELVLVPTALGEGFASVPDFIVRARAVENRIHVAYCNHAGGENGLQYPGLSRLAGPDGAFIVTAGAGEALIIGDIGAARSGDGYPYLEDRRPELYGLICTPR